MIQVLLMILLLAEAPSPPVAAEPQAPVPPTSARAQEGEPWTITGAGLEGTRAGTTVLISPRAVQGSTTVTAREGTWYRDEGLLVLTDEVVLTDSSRTIFADRGSYDRPRGIAILTGNVHGEGPEGKFSAREFRLYRQENRITLHDDVRLVQEVRTLTSSDFAYDTSSREGIATGDVRIVDSSDSTLVTGQTCYLRRDNDEVFVIGGPPTLHRPGEKGEPALDLVADTLQMRQGSVGEARGNVRIHRGDVHSTCARAEYDLKRDFLRLLGDPVATDPDGTVHGDSMAVVMRRNEADRLEVLGHARIDFLPTDKPGERNVVIGDTLIALMDSAGVRTIEVNGRARSLYIPSPADRREDVGQDLSRGRVIRVEFTNGEAQRVDLRGEASGDYVTSRTESSRRDTTITFLPDSVYARMAIDRFLASPDLPLPDSLLRVGPFDPQERVAYAGDSVTFFVPQKRIEIRGKGKVHYQTLDLESEEILYEASKERIISIGKPTLKDPNSALVGERMIYRLDTRQGFAYNGRTEFDGGFYNGQEIKRVTDKILLVKGADYTTCEGGDTTDYHFHASKMKIMLGDKAVARPIFLYIKNIPIMGLPYWIFPIRKGRHSGMLMPDVEFGFDRTRGRFARNLGYYFAPNEYSDEMIWGDYYDSPPRWILNGQVRYKVRYLLGGNFFGSYSKESSTGSGGRTRWDLQGSHDQELGERASLRVLLNFVSDKSYRDDRAFGGSVDERLNRILKSNADLRKTWSSASLSMTLDRTENLDQTSTGYRVQEDLPSVDFNVNSFPIGRKPDERGRDARLPFLSTMYTRLSTSFRSIYLRPWQGSSIYNQAARVNTGLTDNRTLSFLTIAPSVTSTGVWVRNDAQGKSHRFGAVWDAGVSARTALYGTFQLGLGPILGLRHVIEPSVSYRYAPDFTSLRYRDTQGRFQSVFPSVGGISLSGSKASGMSMGLNQRFHLKLRGSDPKKPVRIDNLIQWQTSTSYNFLVHAKPFSSISNSIRLAPSHFFDNSVSMTHDPYRKKMTSLSIQTSLRLSGQGKSSPDSTGGTNQDTGTYGGFGQAEGQGRNRPGERRLGATGPWNLGLTHSYSRGESRDSQSSTMNLSASLTPTNRWRLSYSVYYDLEAHDVRSHGISLYRDLHCWEMRLDQQTSGGNSQYYFRINIKSIPDIQYERQRR
jgi:lipopolysaccharide assembly outer membrane protein LptD (OstA)